METKYDRGDKSFLILDDKGAETGVVRYHFMDEHKGLRFEEEPLTDFTFSLYFQKDIKESNCPTLYIHDDTKDDKKRRIGWMIPFSTLITEDEELQKDNHLSCYVFHSYQYLLSKDDFFCVVDFESLRELIDTKYKNACLCVIHNSDCSLDEQSRLELSLARNGFYTAFPDYVNEKILPQKSLVLFPSNGLYGESGNLIDNYFVECVHKHLNQGSPILKFLYLYQVIEAFISHVLIQNLEKFIDEIKSPGGSFREVSDEVKSQKELTRWMTVEGRAKLKNADYSELDEKCNDFLGRKDNKFSHPDSVYRVRNHIVHRFRVAVQDEKTIKEINDLFELYLLDLLCKYSETD